MSNGDPHRMKPSLQQASDWTPNPYWMYTKCFGPLRWCEWPTGSTVTLFGLWMPRGGFWGFGVELSMSDVGMSWLRLQQTSDWTPHPYWMYTKCFGTLMWCEWPNGSILTLLGMCRCKCTWHLEIESCAIMPIWKMLGKNTYLVWCTPMWDKNY
jgi:hypothetical protein